MGQAENKKYFILYLQRQGLLPRTVNYTLCTKTTKEQKRLPNSNGYIFGCTNASKQKRVFILAFSIFIISVCKIILGLIIW